MSIDISIWVKTMEVIARLKYAKVIDEANDDFISEIKTKLSDTGKTPEAIANEYIKKKKKKRFFFF